MVPYGADIPEGADRDTPKVGLGWCIDNRRHKPYCSVIEAKRSSFKDKEKEMTKENLVKTSPKGSSRISYLYKGVMLSKSTIAGARVSVFVITADGKNAQFQTNTLKEATNKIDDNLANGATVENSRIRYSVKVGA